VHVTLRVHYVLASLRSVDYGCRWVTFTVHLLRVTRILPVIRSTFTISHDAVLFLDTCILLHTPLTARTRYARLIPVLRMRLRCVHVATCHTPRTLFYTRLDFTLQLRWLPLHDFY